MSLVWPEKSIKPDRTGTWAYQGDDGETRVTSIRDEDERQATWPGKWVRIGDLPEIKDPPKYREVTAADVGREIEVEGFPNGTYLVGFSRGGFVVFRHSDGRFYEAVPKCCRILDDGEPAKQPDPELKLGRSYTYDGKKYSLVAWRWDHKQPDEHVGVFEVIDESAS